MNTKQYEYKIHYLQLQAGTPNEDQLLEALNAFGKEGWRLNRLSRTLRPLASWKGGINLLLEREVDA